MFIFVKSHEDFVNFVISVEDNFDCPEEFERCFGFERKFDENSGEILESVKEYNERKGFFGHEPLSYPSVIYFINESGEDRFGKTRLRIYDYQAIPMKELEPEFTRYRKFKEILE